MYCVLGAVGARSDLNPNRSSVLFRCITAAAAWHGFFPFGTLNLPISALSLRTRRCCSSTRSEPLSPRFSSEGIPPRSQCAFSALPRPRPMQGWAEQETLICELRPVKFEQNRQSVQPRDSGVRGGRMRAPLLAHAAANASSSELPDSSRRDQNDQDSLPCSTP